MMVKGCCLPGYDLVDQLLLFRRGAAEIDSGGFDALVSHQICEECDVVAFLKEVFRKTVTERVWVYHFCIQTVFVGEVFKLKSYTSFRDDSSIAVLEDIAGSCHPLSRSPDNRLPRAPL